MERTYLFCRDVAGRVIDFYRDADAHGVHITDGVGIVGPDATVEEFERAIRLAFEHEGLSQLPALPPLLRSSLP